LVCEGRKELGRVKPKASVRKMIVEGLVERREGEVM
jgi:hypothetical protein